MLQFVWPPTSDTLSASDSGTNRLAGVRKSDIAQTPALASFGKLEEPAAKRSKPVTKVERMSSITTLNISLPRSMRAFIMSECERLGFTTVSEYMRSLVREAQQRPANGASVIPGGGARQGGARAKR